MEDFPLNPYAPPEAPLEIQAMESEGLRPLPFEDLDAVPGFWRRVGHMFKLMFTDPYAFYDRMAVTSGLGAPYRFLLLMMVPLIALMVLLFGFMGFMSTLEAGPRNATPRWMVPVMMSSAAVLYPVMIVVGTGIWGLLNHGCLWLWRGTTRSAGLVQSIRATVYTYAFILLVSFIPLIGLFAGLGGAVLLGIGLSRLHRTDMWRGIVAVLSPLVLCCGAYIAFFVFAIAASSFK